MSDEAIDNLQIVSDLTREASKAQVFREEPLHFAIVPKDHTLVSLAEFQFAEPPPRKKAAVSVIDVPSFGEYFNRFKSDASMIFADPPNQVFIGVLDYHEKADGAANHRRHTVKLTLQTTDRWKAWHGANKKQMAQETFAAFIEDNSPDIFAPDGTVFPSAADMLDISRTLTARSNYEFLQTTDLKNGQRGVVYKEVIDGQAGPRGDMPIPDRFAVLIPIYVNQKATLIECRLRYRIAQGKLSLWYDMFRVDEILLAEFESARERVEKHTETPVLLGSQT